MKKTFFILLLLLLISIASYAIPMSGSYTIGITGDYATIQSAVDAVQTNGIDGDITFYLQAGTYDEQIDLHEFNPLGTHNVAFRKDLNLETCSVILTNSNANSANNYIFSVLGAKNLTFFGLEFVSQQNYGTAIYISGTTHNIEISGNNFQGVSTTSPSNHNLIHLYSDMENGRIQDITINQNTFNYGGNQILHSSGISNDFQNIHNIVIADNNHNSGYKAIYLQRSYYADIHHNVVWFSRSGIEVTEGKGAIVRNNLIHSRIGGITISNVNFFVISPLISGVFNNQVTVTGENDSGTGNNAQSTGLSVSGSNYAKIYHNSVVLKTVETWYSYAVSFSGNSNGNLKNNQIMSYGDAKALYLGTADVNREDYNNVFSNGVFTVRMGNYSYVTYDEYRDSQDLTNNSMSLDPFFHNHGAYFLYTDFFIGKGTPISFITTDCFGGERSDTYPDIGAIECEIDPAFSPLSGAYSIGSNHDMFSLGYALNSIAQRGMNGAVHFLLEEPQQGNFNLRNIPGASETNTLTIYGTDTNRISFDPPFAEHNYLVELISANHVTFDGVYFENLNPTYGNMVKARGLNQSINFENCTFEGFYNTGDSTNRASFKAESNSLLRTVNFNNCTFNNNSYGIYISGDHNQRGSSVSVNNSMFTNQRNSAYFRYVNDVTIHWSEFIDSYYYGLYIETVENVSITKNKILSAQANTGIYTGNITGSLDNSGNRTNFIANNIIKIDAGTNGGACGIRLAGSFYDIMHNSIKTMGTNSKTIYSYNSPPNSRIINNALHNSGGKVIEFIHNIPDTFIMDYNCYYADGHIFAQFIDTFSSFNQFREAYPLLNQNSYNANPMFDDEMHSDSPWIKDKGLTTPRVTEDHFSHWRAHPYDIGAHELLTQSYSFPAFDDNIVTIGAGQEYSDLQDAFDALEKRGITTNDTLYFRLADTTYTGKFQLNQIPRYDNLLVVYSDAVLAIEPLDSSMPVSFYPPDDFTQNESLILINGADRVRFNNLTFHGGTSYHNNCLGFAGSSELITINNSVFHGADTTIPKHAINADRVVLDYLTIEDSEFNSFDQGFLKSNPHYFNPKTTSYLIKNNSFNDVKYPVSVSFTNNVRIQRNEMHNFIQAIYVSGSDRNLRIQQNKMFTADISGGYSDYTLILLNGINGAEEVDRNYVHANILVCENASSRTLNGIHIYNSQNMIIDNNTIMIEQKYWYGTALTLSYPNNILIRNNVLTMDGYGMAFNITSDNNLTMSHNAFYSLNPTLAKVGNDNYETLEALQTGTNFAESSYFVYPYLDDNGYVQAEFLKDKGTEAYFSYDVDNGIWYAFAIGANLITPYYSLTPVSSNLTVGADYPTMQEVFDVLGRRGVSEHIDIILNTDVTGENFVVRPIPLSSPNSTVTLTTTNINNPILSYHAANADSNYILGLRAVSNFAITNTAFVSENAFFQTAIQLKGINRNIVIQSCEFSGIETTSNYADRAFININEHIYDYLTIQTNAFQSGGTGVYIRGRTNTSFYNHALFYGNSFEDMCYGISAQNIGSSNVYTNFFYNMDYQAIDMRNIVDQLKIAGNKIRHKKGSGIYLANINTPVEVQNYIQNNFVTTIPGWSANSNMYVVSANNMNIVNNTLQYAQNYASGQAFEKGAGCSNMTILNNIFSNNQTGKAATFNAPDEVNEIDYNLFYALITDKVVWGSTIFTSADEFPATGNFSHSLIADPLFTDDNDYILQDDSPAIDAGTTLSYLTFDINGFPRVVPYDIGAWERQEYSTLTQPQNVSIHHNTNDSILEISWNAVDGAQYYIIEAADSPDGSFVQIGTANTTEYNYSTLDAPTKRFFRIIAAN